MPARWVVSLLSYERPDTILAAARRLAQQAHRLGAPLMLVVGEHSAQLDLRRALTAIATAGGMDFLYREDRGNPGFGIGHNRNFTASGARGDDIFVVMNDDFAVDLPALHEAGAALLAQGAILSSEIRMPDGALWYGGGRVSRWTGDLCKAPAKVGATAPWRSEYVTGCLLLCQAQVYRRVGGFAEDYFMYSEDTALCRRAAGQGVAMWVLPVTGVHSVGSGADGHYSQVYLREGTRNRITELLRQSKGHIAIKLTYAILYLWLGRLAQLALARRLNLGLARQITAAAVGGLWRGVRGAPERVLPDCD